MLRSMYSGISGMKGSQNQLDVIGNNIANVNTSGFKKGRVTFQDLMSQTTTGAEGPTGNRGGTNAKQVGLGVQDGSIDDLHTQGHRQTTENPLDLEIEGDGMFVLEDGDDELYSRAGNFYLDNDGDIVNADGLYLLGTDEKHISIPENADDFSVGESGKVTYIQDGDEHEAGQIALANFSNPGGLEKQGNSLYRETDNAGVNGRFNTPNANGTGTIVSGSLEMSNVDLSDEFTDMITAQRGFQANTRIITTSDEILQELVNLKQ